MLNVIFSLNTLWWLMLVLYTTCCVGLIVVVLLQKGKGAGFAGAFGVGAGSETLFGPRMARTLPQKLTYVAAGLFMVLALVMSTLSGRVGKGSAPSLVDENAPIESASMNELFNNGENGAAGQTQNSTSAVTVVTPESAPAPAAQTPAPAAQTPAPAAETPAPAVETPAPAAETPAPAAETPAPAAETPAPAAETPAAPAQESTPAQ